MRQENNYNETAFGTTVTGNDVHEAFQHLKSLPPNFHRPVLARYIRERESEIIDHEIAECFTSSFRGTEQPFHIPVSWTLTKSALINLLGITSYEGHQCVNGIRFYAGINPERQLTLVAVSTKAGAGCHDDLTIEDEYPYYDYADPCPINCSNTGNLKALDAASLKVVITE